MEELNFQKLIDWMRNYIGLAIVLDCFDCENLIIE